MDKVDDEEATGWSCSSSESAPSPVPSSLVDDLNRLRSRRRGIMALLHDEEEREIYEASVHLWMRELRGIADDAEEVLHDCEYGDSRVQIQDRMVCPNGGGGGGRKTEAADQVTVGGGSSIIPSPSHNKNSEDGQFWGRIASRVQKISARFEEICTHRRALRLEAEEEIGRRRLPRRNYGEIIQWVAQQMEDCSSSSSSSALLLPPSAALGDDVAALPRLLARIKAFLYDAEEREIYDLSLHLWLRELRGVASDAKWVLDEYYEHGRRGILQGQQAEAVRIIQYQEPPLNPPAKRQKAADQQVRGSATTITTAAPLDMDSVHFWDRIASKIQKIKASFEEIARHREALCFGAEDGRRVRRKTGEHDLDRLLGQGLLPLLSDDSSGRDIGDDLKQLARLLARIEAFLYDVEESEIYALSPHLWLRELRGVASGAKRVLDEYYQLGGRLPLLQTQQAEAAQIIQDQEPPLNPHAKRQKAADQQQIRAAEDLLPVDGVRFWDRIASKIQKIKASFEEIARHREALRFRVEDGRRLRRKAGEHDLGRLLGQELLALMSDDPSERDIGDDLKQLARLLARIKAFLVDAGERDIFDESVHAWVQELKGVAYDADLVLDEREYQLLRAKILDEALPNLDDAHLSQIGEIRERFKEISRSREVFLLISREDRRGHHLDFGRRPLGSPFLIDGESKVHIQGRKRDLDRLIDGLLQSDECSKSSNLRVIPVVGMPGVGKTTLVQHVYNNCRVEQHFDLRGWVYVSIEFDVIRLTKDILECLTITACDLTELGALQNRLVEVLKGRRLLLVLDDVWNEDGEQWERLRAPLNCAGKGSAVVATTRSEITANIMQTVQFHRLGCLSNDTCRAILQHYAFRGLIDSNHEEFVKIAGKIALKCKGLPLAAEVLGRILRCHSDAEEWEDVLQSETWQLDFEHGGMLSTSMPSYLHLPPFLKQCFVYCSLFPRDYSFQRDDLVLLWIAQGFIWCDGETPVEDIGAAYVDELIQRSLFQCNDAKYKSFFVMHDMIHNLAQYLSKGEYCRIEEGRMPFQHSGSRHLSIADRGLDIASVLESLPCWAAWGLRTLHLFQVNKLRSLPSILLPNFEGLRTLILGGQPLAELPDWIGDLKHLRYLDLSGTLISKLPETVCNLHRLQTLLLRHCKHLQAVPRVTLKLMNLRYLRFSR